MAILKIARMGHPVLARPSEPVSDPKSPEIRGLVSDMIETLADVGGVGLAAPQVHVGLRLVIFHVPPADDAAERYRDAGLSDDEGVPLTVLINPEIESIGDDQNGSYESCLSLPEMSGWVDRATHIRYRGLDLNGDVIEREARDFHARVVQHECDHLDGILYPMRMTDLSRFGYTEDMKRGSVDEEYEDEPHAEAGSDA